MSSWQIIVPEATTNYIENPSAEVNETDGWTLLQGGLGGAVARTTTYQKYGVASFRLLAGTDYVLIQSDAISLANGASVTVSGWMRKQSGITAVIRVRDTTTPANRTSTSTTTAAVGAWEYVEATWTNDTGGAVNVALQATNSANDSASYVWADGLQMETKAYATTYCDGTQPGCEWLAAPNNSYSQRSAVSRSGGVVYDIEDDLGFNVTAMSSVGMGPITQIMDEFALAPGGEVQGFKEHVRVFILSGLVQGTSMANLHSLRQALIDVVAPNSVPNNQPILFRYTGAAVPKEIAARYDGGLELSMSGEQCNYERMAMRFLATDPFWYEIGNSAATLSASATPTLRYVTARLRSTGQWDDLGLTADPDAGGTPAAIAYNPVDGLYYVGGSFDDLNNTGTNIDFLASYNVSTDTWALVGAGSAVNGNINAIAIAPNGDVYVGGAFTNLGGATGDTLAYWDISAGSWAVPGDPTGGGASTPVQVYALAFDSEGNLYIAGDFPTFGGVANTAGFVQWTGAAYAAVGDPDVCDGVGASQFATDIAIDSNNHIYVGGNFTIAGSGADADYLVYWNGTTWAAPGTALTAQATALLALPNDDIIVSADQVDIGGGANCDYIAQWNGQAYVPLATGLNGYAAALALGPDGIIYAGGEFTAAGSLTWIDYAAKWNGAIWAHMDMEPSGAPVVTAICCARQDPDIKSNYDIFLGFNTSGASEIAGTATVTNPGTADAYPTITVKRTGGTAARLKQIRNETTGRELLFGYALLADETLTINLDPFNTTVVSSFYGDRPNAILKNSDVGTFKLQPGSNQITCFVDVAGGPTITALMVWRDAYLSVD